MKWFGMIPCISIKPNAEGNITLNEIFGINHQSKTYMYFNIFVIMCCAVSSYIYCAMAAFRLNSDDFYFYLSLLFESVFVVDMLSHFVLSFRKEGSSL